MILIIAHHYAIHGGFELSKQAFSAQLFFLQVLSYGGKLGVNLFVLISGYFLVTSRCKLKKAVNLWMKVTVFSACIAIVNLPPRPMMGIESCGMLLSAIHTEEGEEKLHLLMVDDHIPAGAKLY